MNPIFWSNVGVDVQTSLDAALPLSNITKASPGVVSWASGTDPAPGSYVLMNVQGMFQVNNRVLRLANVNGAGNSADLEGEDTSLYDSISSGSNMSVINFGASMQNGQNIQVSGGDPEFTDITTIHENMRRRAPTVVSPLSLAFDTFFDLADPAFVELNKAYKTKTMRAIRLRFSNGYKMLFLGYASAAGVPTGQAQGVVQTKLSIEAQNFPSWYTS